MPVYNRQQYVNINDHESDMANVVCGVPQGSILGPKLFILYINDICNTSSLLKFILFADDTTIFWSGRDLTELSRQQRTGEIEYNGLQLTNCHLMCQRQNLWYLIITLTHRMLLYV